ncbi:hypothetical protein [Desulfobacter hydrogenophilus]|nr:hypothetical protein [Desulfobacter hydrogenophilus]NDY71667.1 hypothetical protein [Desulfobacter hydrogenophilus]QBH13181.1 hypothetical protein EYB58_09770 [Desulfobacter hydrogenophilus]
MLLDQINTMKPWTIGHKRCPVCGKGANFYAAEHPACKDCFLKALEIELIREDISHWSRERFSLSLSSSGAMRDRLLALIHFRNFQSMEDMAELLIDNLGFDSDHPLAWYTRQKAYEACVFFEDSEKMFETVLSTKKFGSWQQKANMVKLCCDKKSESPKIIQFIGQMANDPSPNVRSHVAGSIRDNKKGWAKKLCAQLRYDKNALVREVFERIQYNRETAYNPKPYIWREEEAGMIERARTIKKQVAAYNKMEMDIRCYCDFPMQNQVYTLYLSHLPDLLDKNKDTEKNYAAKELAALKENTEDSCVRLLAAAVSNDFLFNTILEKLPEDVVALIYIMAWECEECESCIAEQKLVQLMDKDLPADTVADKKTPLHESVKKDPAYFMFKVTKNYAYYRHDTHFISISYPLRPFIKKRLPPPAFARLVPLVDIKGKVEWMHEDDQGIFRQLPPILSFIAQGNLKFTKNGKEVLKGSLKKMTNACGIDEFYIDDVNELKYLKTKLLADFFNCMPPWKAKELEDPTGFLKTRINQYFSFEGFTGHSSRSMFAHVKRQMEDFDSNDAEKNMRKNFKKVLNLLPEKKWIATRDLAMTAFYDGIDFNPFSKAYEFTSLYITRNLPHYTRRDNIYLQKLPTIDILTLPYIKAMMFLMGALGLVELGYSTPENNIFRQYNKSWLSIYDGLKYVRLTEFGSYVIGRKTRFTHDIVTQSAEIEIDEHKTMLSIYGNDPVKQMALEALGQQVTNSSYMVSYQSFLKDCSTHKDVENKIQFFRDNIIAEPPPIWEIFFKEVLARMNPLEQVPAMSVFRVKPDRELLTLLTRDNILKKYVFRAENHHILVKTSDFSKVKKRLAFLGFFIS